MLETALLGLGIAAIYALLAQGIVVIYRGSGVVNLAQGAYAMLGAFLYYQLRTSHGFGFALASLTAVLCIAALGAATHLLVMRPLTHASPVARLIATLGMLIVLQSTGLLYFGSSTVLVQSSLPDGVLHVGGIYVPEDRLILIGIACGLTAVLWVASRFTLFGLIARGVAENPQAASALGWSPDRVATVNWAAGCALAAAAGILVVPLTGLQVTNLTLIVIAALAVALIGRFTSFPVILLGALGIGIAQSEMVRYWNQQGVSDALPLVIIAAILMFHERSLPVRGTITDRLPRLGTARAKPLWVVLFGLLFSCLVRFVFPMTWNTALANTIIVAIFLLSVVVLTGYAGQVSLAQYALGGVGAFVAGRLVDASGWPAWAAIPIGVLAAMAVGLLFALPALRTRGVNLAVVTLGLGLSLQSVLFNNASYTGGTNGTTVGPLRLAGIDLDPIKHPDRYALLTFLTALVCMLAVSNVRRGRVGRRMIAVRSNERAAASLGIRVVSAKLYAFVLSSALAGVAGILLGFSAYSIVFTNYDPISSIYAVALSVIGGVGYISGALLGSTLSQSGIGSLIGQGIFGTNVGNWLTLGGGVTLILLLVRDPDGMASATTRDIRRLSQSLRRFRREPTAASDPVLVFADPAVERVPAIRLDASAMSVHFGGVIAVDHVTLAITSGEIVGVIGPNGAGKTTLIDAITGFANLSGGEIRVNGERIDQSPAYRRSRLGITRSFQSLELFEELTVRDNLLAASDPRDAKAYASTLLWPGRPELPATVLALVHEFGLATDLERLVTELPFGRRRLVGIARAIATGASIVMLDEPSAGLSDDETAELARVFRRLAHDWGVGVLLVEHDMNLVMNICDRVIVLDFGHKIAEGTAQEVRHDDQVIASYLGVPDDDSLSPNPVSMTASSRRTK
jgi:sulfate-transporting ATPase